MNKLYCILSHCDTDHKISILKKNIEILKSLDYDILLVSHVPLDKEIVNSVNYFIYDKSNPIFYYPQRYMMVYNFISVRNKQIKLEMALPDYGWTVLNQIQKTSAFCNNLSYDFYEFINYDLNLSDEILKYNKQSNFLTKVKHYDSDEIRFPSTLWFGIDNNTIEKIKEDVSKEDYLQINPRDTEDYFLRKMEKYGFDTLEIPTVDTIKCHLDKKWWGNFNIENEYFKLFFDNDSTVIYDLINPIKFSINGEDYLVSENTQLNFGKIDIKSIGYYDYDNGLVDIIYLFNSNNHTSITYE